MRLDIPSTMSLLAFEAAARHLSFTSAGRELDLTQTAISHQIKSLEDRLGTKLFLRRRNMLQLTGSGRNYLESVREAINVLHNATIRTKREKTSETLTISCLPTYATKCLIPALPEFQRAHPGIILQLMTSQSFDQFKQRSYDVAIRYGSGRWQGLRTDLLYEEEIFPICTPELAAEIRCGDPTAALAAMTQVRTYFSSNYQDDWPGWLEAAGFGMVNFAREAIFNLQLTSLQAAINGVGVAIGRTPLVNVDLASGALAAPIELRLRTGSSYYLVASEEKADLPKVQAFREWACERLSTARSLA
ncbi:MAG: LysR family transcriptional regulator [Massilia sp.]|jgi:LysR family glycine cleavage system transcriptional activator|nr:LysR family transcriptional regulator [Massilia sp.]MDB5950779.1 LysR family transcriptional regulator [Massilia sp.]